MTDQNYTLADLKDRAKTLRKSHPNLTHSAALEAIAHQMGFRDWNTLAASAQPSPRWAVGDKVSGRYLGHQFTGVIVRLTGEPPNFHMTIHFDAPVDVVESEAFTNLRSKVNVVLNAKGQTREKTSDGRPHMVLD